jgi:hypothetical protein
MKQPALDWVLVELAGGVYVRSHLHGGTRRNKRSEFGSKPRSASIYFRPDDTYGVGPSGGLMRGYGPGVRRAKRRGGRS